MSEESVEEERLLVLVEALESFLELGVIDSYSQPKTLSEGWTVVCGNRITKLTSTEMLKAFIEGVRVTSRFIYQAQQGTRT